MRPTEDAVEIANTLDRLENVLRGHQPGLHSVLGCFDKDHPVRADWDQLMRLAQEAERDSKAANVKALRRFFDGE